MNPIRSLRATGLLLLPLLLPLMVNAVTHEVIIEKFAYQPQTITVKAGDTVRWVNNEKRQYHNVWFEQPGEPEPGYFFPGESYERTFDQPGSFPYHCGPHPEMTGTVIVTEQDPATGDQE